jgi:hypothetical protein
MAKSKKKKQKPNLEDLKKFGKGFENIASELEGELEEKLKPLMDLSNLTKSINKLKEIIPENEKMKKNGNDNNPYPDKEGEACMHDNSWHSECSECDAFDIVDEVIHISENEPNDSELGKKIREFVTQLKEYPYNIEFGGSKTKEEMDTMQMNLFDDTDN